MSEKDELINEWIDKADHDLGSAKLIYLHIPKYFDTIAFHCQQAVEKYLKAVLVFYPDNSICLTKEELETSIQVAQDFRAFAINAIGIIENNTGDNIM